LRIADCGCSNPKSEILIAYILPALFQRLQIFQKPEKELSNI
jgi:hypothetical protein